MSDRPFHVPVMSREVVQLLAVQPGGIYLDGTVGGGGHAEALLEAGPEIRVLALDRDDEALARARVRLERFGDRIRFAAGNFAAAGEAFGLGEGALAGVLLDLGVSSHQIDTEARGFSFRRGVPLDMRMTPGASGPSAADLLAELDAGELAHLFRDYGEERSARRLADEIVRRREDAPLRTSDELEAAVEAVWGRPPSAGDLARLFQALRIAVNRELEALEVALPRLRDLLGVGGRFAVISYHSLEDRLVKRAFREWSRRCVCPPELPVCRCRGKPLGADLTRGPVRPREEEIAGNPRARSARLRVWERGE